MHIVTLTNNFYIYFELYFTTLKGNLTLINQISSLIKTQTPRIKNILVLFVCSFYMILTNSFEILF
jgi:hypothetical protein